MSKFMRIKDAEDIFPGFREYPHMKAKDSIIFMQIAAGWNTKLCIRVGDSYYYLKDHPNVKVLSPNKK